MEIKSHAWFWRPNYNRADNILKVYKVLKQVPIATNKTELLYLVQKNFHYVFQSNLRIGKISRLHPGTQFCVEHSVLNSIFDFLTFQKIFCTRW